uniref:Uncharacterized protein n=1 Tax=Candidatus Komeilibacteria bacterium CG_4_10_14_0_8_um_filter_37_78 TaxID=1974471 RepID=A0A2M7RF45_9BACT|nr:MAG: hypothetical protein COY67_01095 [Candidatus Komeilibacteria bacterium CG_4_10_14_0_8_um_filter_37_78]
MTKKLFILALILLAINYFFGEQIDAWWQEWRSGDKMEELSESVIDRVGENIVDGFTQNENSQEYTPGEIQQMSQGLPEEIQLQIDNWLLEQDLNQYGDPEETMYAGGTPTFDETTGETTNRFELIFSKFPGLIDQFQVSLEELRNNQE